MQKHILTVRNEKIGKIIFNNPKKLNPLNHEVMKEVVMAVEELEEDPKVRVILFTGKGKGFSAGADYAFMDVLTAMKPNEIKNLVYKHFVNSIKTIKLCSKPTIAAVRGPAVGAGCEIAVACDFRIVSETAMFKEVWVKLGLI